MPVAEEFQEQVLSVVRKGNEITLDAIKATVKAAAALRQEPEPPDAAFV